MIIDNVEYSEIKSKNENARTKVDFSPSLRKPFCNLEGGYSLIYDNMLPIDMKYIDYDRNVKHVGSK
jgi:hypothetical protein